AQTKKPPTAVGIPVYQPPRRGAPRGRVGGGTRGPGDQWPVLSVLAPDDAGLTVEEQPSLFWYLSNSTTYPIEVTIIDEQAIQPLFSTCLSPPVQPGVQRVRLTEYGVRLLPGVKYEWFVALVFDPDRRSKDILAGGVIERIELPEALRAKLVQAGKAEIPRFYAEAGIWYDAVTAISDLIDTSPDDPVFRKQRASLLEQVGLPETAEYDMRHSPAD
ncbi:MAG: DUF928 domain-containing protein, partial [Acidimicrobiia bacterium]